MSERPCYVCQVGHHWPTRPEVSTLCEEHAADLVIIGWGPRVEGSHFEGFKKGYEAGMLEAWKRAFASVGLPIPPDIIDASGAGLSPALASQANKEEPNQ